MESATALNINWPNPNPRARGFGGFGRFGNQDGADRPTYEERVQQLKDYFAEARAYRDAVAAGEQVRTDARYIAMTPALNRDIPVVVSANSAAQINDAITWAKAEDLRLVIRGGNDAIHVADRLVAEEIPVILTSTMAAPTTAQPSSGRAKGPNRDETDSGIPALLSTGGSGVTRPSRPTAPRSKPVPPEHKLSRNRRSALTSTSPSAAVKHSRSSCTSPGTLRSAGAVFSRAASSAPSVIDVKLSLRMPRPSGVGWPASVGSSDSMILPSASRRTFAELPCR